MELSRLNALSSPLDEQQLVNLKTALTDLSSEQVAWVSGYLAGLGATPAPVAAPRAESPRGLTILYGSQTGNARSVAEGLGEEALAQGLKARVLSMADFKPRNLTKERALLILVSTKGEGEPPESGLDLYSLLGGKRAPRLEELRYAVLGLGDSSYEFFCQAALDFDQRLAALGARRLSPDQVLAVAEAVVTTQRDLGDRYDRAHARLKYAVERIGLDAFRAEVERRSGVHFQRARAVQFTDHGDRFGWVEGAVGHWHLTLYIENGRVQDEPGRALMTGLRAIANIHQGDFRMTPNQNLILAGVPANEKVRIEALAREHGLLASGRSPLRLRSIACVALPTCPQAMAEAERYFPELAGKVEALSAKHGLADLDLVLRITGCPNGCARPYLAEIGLVGKGPGKYNLLLGGDGAGARLNKLYRQNIGEEQILATLNELFARFAAERAPGERFGDFVIRAGIVWRVIDAARDFHD